MAAQFANFRHSAMEPVTVIIPAYNEAKRIGAVIDAVVRTPLITQIVVIDDGSKDCTADVVAAWQKQDKRIRLIARERNQGKAAAIALGGKQAVSDIIVLLDADLRGLQPQHIRRLIAPVRRRECAMTIGLFRSGRWSTDVTHRVLPFLSGQRCLRWSSFKETLLHDSAGWSLETALNLHAWYYQLAVQNVLWMGVTHAMRPEKQPGLRGYTSHITMWSQIFRYTAEFVDRMGAGEVWARLQVGDSASEMAAALAGHRGAHRRRQLMRRPLL